MNRAGLYGFLLCAAAAQAQITIPTLGYVPDGPRIRVMQGIPGAGVVGPIVATGRDLARIAISPRQDYILATDAATGEVLKIVPGSTPVSVTPVAGAAANPDVIVMSPNGSSAVLWFWATNQAQVISGLPASPTVREINTSILGDSSPGAIAISDDGNSLAASSAIGAYVFASDGSLSAIPLGDVATALAFFHNRAMLAAATDSHIFLSDLDLGTPPSSVDVNSELNGFVAIATSSDNSRVVAVGSFVTIISVDLTSNTTSTLECDCVPIYLYGLGGSIFRVKGLGGDVQLFDAANNRILEVPNALSATMPAHDPSPRNPYARSSAPAASLPALPAVTLGGLPASSGPDQQPAMTVSIASAYSLAITGTATLNFVSSVGGDDQTIQFGTGGRTVSFTIPAGSTQATFSGKSSVAVLTGTVAGTITITLDLTASGTDITSSPAPTATTMLITTVPFIQTVQLLQSSDEFSVQIEGFSTTRDMVSGTFQFAPSSNATLATSSVTVSLSTAFTTWYSGTASNAFGSQFLLTVPFTTQKGPAADVVAVTVTLTNSKGTSNSAVNQ